MRIINKANGRETTVSTAVSLVVGCDDTSELRGLVVRLIEELCQPANRRRTLNAASLSRILAYKFKVED